MFLKPTSKTLITAHETIKTWNRPSLVVTKISEKESDEKDYKKLSLMTLLSSIKPRQVAFSTKINEIVWNFCFYWLSTTHGAQNETELVYKHYWVLFYLRVVSYDKLLIFLISITRLLILSPVCCFGYDKSQSTDSRFSCKKLTDWLNKG